MLRFTKNRHDAWVIEGDADELIGPGTTQVKTRRGPRTVTICGVGRAFHRRGRRMRYGYLSEHRAPISDYRLASVGRPGG